MPGTEGRERLGKPGGGGAVGGEAGQGGADPAAGGNPVTIVSNSMAGGADLIL